ncbi:hypothetical protein Pcinc_025128 [Petrolisthes cinctipes]|uniref:SAYSvFN domain-containing protein n=1 Tax=Petrolisthes cinctipes TaxID=88211 RepID=A0AAE1KE78_PETCI|nr:hypothetical protein Pcinc_025128 [Petrolisthes cinctipes]
MTTTNTGTTGKVISVDEQLAVYRRRRKKEDENKARKEKLWAWITWFTTTMSQTVNPLPLPNQQQHDITTPTPTEHDQPNTEVKRRKLLTKNGSLEDSTESNTSNTTFLSHYTKLDWLALALTCFLWALLMKIAIVVEFGAVFFIFSAFIFMWYNMRTGPKKRGEISAYSVFNPNCENIGGTYTAEQFERELLHKM